MGGTEGVGGKCGNEVSIISHGQMTFCLLPDFLAQWVDKISEAFFFFDFVFPEYITI